MSKNEIDFKAFMAGAIPSFGLGNWILFAQIHIDTAYWVALVGVGVGKLVVNLAFAILTGIGTNKINLYYKKRKQNAKRQNEEKKSDSADKTNAA